MYGNCARKLDFLKTYRARIIKIPAIVFVAWNQNETLHFRIDYSKQNAVMKQYLKSILRIKKCISAYDDDATSISLDAKSR